MQALKVAGVDSPVGQRALAQPGEQAVPLAVAQQHDREVADRAGLDQRERLEELVERAEAAGSDHEGARVAHEHDFAGEEVPEAQADVDVGVEVLLAGQLDVAPDRQRPGVAGSEVRRLHQPRPAAGDDRVAGASQAARDRAHEGVVRMFARGARRAEHGHRPAHAGERVKAAGELGADLVDALGVGGPDVGGLILEPEEELLVEGGRALRAGHACTVVSGSLRSCAPASSRGRRSREPTRRARRASARRSRGPRVR